MTSEMCARAHTNTRMCDDTAVRVRVGSALREVLRRRASERNKQQATNKQVRAGPRNVGCACAHEWGRALHKVRCRTQPVYDGCCNARPAPRFSTAQGPNTPVPIEWTQFAQGATTRTHVLRNWLNSWTGIDDNAHIADDVSIPGPSKRERERKRTRNRSAVRVRSNFWSRNAHKHFWVFYGKPMRRNSAPRLAPATARPLRLAHTTRGRNLPQRAHATAQQCVLSAVHGHTRPKHKRRKRQINLSGEL